MKTIFSKQQCHKIVKRKTFHRLREKTFVPNMLCLDLPLAEIWLKSPIIPKRSSVGSLLFPVKGSRKGFVRSTICPLTPFDNRY